MNDPVTDAHVNAPDAVAGDFSHNTADAPATVSGEPRPAVRYATDTEVDEAMEKIFVQHDQLLAELAK